MTLYIDMTKDAPFVAVSMLTESKFVDINLDEDSPQGIALDLLSAPKIIEFGRTVTTILRMLDLDVDEREEIRQKTFDIHKIIIQSSGVNSALTKIAAANFGEGYAEIIKTPRSDIVTSQEVFMGLHSRLQMLKAITDYAENTGYLKIFKAGKQYTVEVALDSST